jgi:hypothetical protein
MIFSCEEKMKLEEIHFPYNSNKTGEPYLTVSDNELFISWIEEKIDSNFLYMSKLVDNKWNDKELIVKGKDWFVNWADFPSISINKINGLKIAHYLKKSSIKTFSYDVNFLVNTSDSWQLEQKMHSDKTLSEHGFVSIQPFNDGFISSWLDGRNTSHNNKDLGHASGPMSLRSAIINSQGKVIKEIEIDDMVCDCCQTSIAVSNDIPIIVYRDRSQNEIRDISVSRFINSSWSKPYSLNDDKWKINGCPVNGPSIKSNGRHVVVAWFSAANGKPEVNVKFSNNQGKSFGKKILINTSEVLPLGRVDIDFIDNKQAVISWMSTNNGIGSINLRKIGIDGVTGDIISLSNISDSRATGFPQIEKLDNHLILSFTDENDGLKKIKTFKVPISSL